MTERRQLWCASIALALIALVSCGGGSSGGGGNQGGGSDGGGGGGTGSDPAPTINAVSPSSVMVNIPLGLAQIYGSNFTNDAVVLLDGQPRPTTVRDSTTLEISFDLDFDATVATHQIAVRQSSGTSNTLSLSVYDPPIGPQVMTAVPGFYVAYETDPTWIAVADVDGDGFDDVLMPAAGGSSTGSILALKGRRDGSLAPPTLIAPSTPSALAAGDVDGDGVLDLVSITDDSNLVTVSVLRGDGHGNFQPVGSPQTFDGSYPKFAQLADLDGDGKSDLLLSAETPAGNGATILWLANQGGGNFSPEVPLIVSTGGYGYFAVGDVNHDSKPDIVYTTTNQIGTPVVHTLTNQGGGQFTDAVTPGLNGVGGVAHLIDFNLDGVPDLVVESVQNSITHLHAFRGVGDGSFQHVSDLLIPGVFLFVVGDFDHDGYPDLAGTDGETEPSYTMFLFGDGQGNFTAQRVVGPQGEHIAVGDVNGDGVPDAVIPDRFEYVSLVLGRNDRKYPSALALTPQGASVISAGDIDGDGLPEILVPSGLVYQNLGNSSFQLAAFTDPRGFILADLTGKGVADLIGISGGTTLLIWPNDGTLGFYTSSPIEIQVPSNWPIFVADMDGDGHPDIVCSQQILYGNGSYQFTAVPMVGLGPLGIGDFNGDGRPDIASVPLFLNTGNRTFEEIHSDDSPFGEFAQAAVGDFNQDGCDDVALVFPGVQDIGVYQSRGDGTFFQSTYLNPGQYVGALTAGDFNGDGRTDIAAGLMWSHQAVIFFNGGNGQFSRSFFASGAFTVAMTAADLNRTGNIDLIFTNFLLDAFAPNVDVVFHK